MVVESRCLIVINYYVAIFIFAGWIPTSIPASCLTTAPRFERPQAQRSAVVPSKPLLEHNPRGSPITLQGKPKIGLNNSMDQGYEMSSQDIMELIRSMKTQLLETLQGRGVRSAVNIDGKYFFVLIVLHMRVGLF